MRARRCPICGKAAARPAEEPFPFCSERCRLIDLGRWLGESYRLPDPAEGGPIGRDPWNDKVS